MNKVKIIAEIGVNHNGKMKLAKRLINEAKKCGADAVKFQSYITEEFVLPETKKTDYQNNNLGKKISHFQMLKNYEFSFKQFKEIANHCKIKKIEFMSTPYDIKSFEYLITLGVNSIKIASADLNDHSLHQFANKSGKNIIISTGMSELTEIKKTLKLYNNKKKITLLHCTSNYPCSLKSVNLRSIKTIKNMFKCKVGYSDHTNFIETSIAAVAMGCNVIEKHFTLDNNMKGPDHLASFNPKKFTNLVEGIRRTETLMGNTKKEIQLEERKMKNISSKSITLIVDKKKNSLIKSSDIKMMRPGLGLNGSHLKKIIGKKLKKDVKKLTQLKNSHFKK